MSDPAPKRLIFRDATEADLPFNIQSVLKVNEVYNWNIINSFRLEWFRSLKTGNIKGESYPCLLGLTRDPDGQEAKFGYVCYLPWISGEEFELVVEISLYIAQDYTGRGLGAELLAAILAHPSTRRLRGIVATITTENRPSSKFFAKHGFTYSGQLDNVGYKFERWLDVAYYTLYLPEVPSVPEARLEHESPHRTAATRLVVIGDHTSSIKSASYHHPTAAISCRDIKTDDLPESMVLGFFHLN
ncbi:GNAT family acetyltransferase [Ceratobasidium sp. AG-Ba]|nr:GNAT family acetyltransferase [Ceratobasidium sp. AG-Ba]QRW03928.1 GNAT family acetyltransferase [Ceratobasidium sp. AG-Ba]